MKRWKAYSAMPSVINWEVPKTLQELFKFYSEYVKPLYSSVQATNKLPAETLFEINAALDHLSRHWCFNEDEATVVEKAYGHLKRSCLDIFKLKFKETRDQYDELCGIDTSILDNGRFEQEMRESFVQVKRDAISARIAEGHTGNDESPFERWAPVYDKCVLFEEKFHQHADLEWAKKKGFRISVKKFVLSIIVSIVSGAIVTVVIQALF